MQSFLILAWRKQVQQEIRRTLLLQSWEQKAMLTPNISEQVLNLLYFHFIGDCGANGS